MNNRLVPAAIVTGCALIAASIFFGLRGAPHDAANRPAAGPELFARVKAQALSGLDRRRSAMASACAPGRTPRAALSFSLAFDPSGRETGRGISAVDRTDANADLIARCLREKFPPELRIEPSATTVSIVVPFALP